jgi:arginase
MVALIPVQTLQRPIVLIEAPTNLGLRPPRSGIEPGAWEAPQALRAAGLGSAIGSRAHRALPRPVYHPDPPPFSTIRNAYAIYHFTLNLAAEIGEVFASGDFPLVIGGDCSVLLGGLLAARWHGRFGLVHLDGHSDFFHPGNYDVASRPGAVAGMDLALAIGLGESLLTRWDDDAQPLIDPHDVIQIGERESRDPDFAFADLPATGISQIDIFEVNEIGITETWGRAEALFDRRGLDAFWLHLDLDVLDQRVMPAVDCPGSPGLDFDQLAQLLRLVHESERCIGADITIYDPGLDPTGEYARAIVECLGNGFRSSFA